MARARLSILVGLTGGVLCVALTQSSAIGGSGSRAPQPPATAQVPTQLSVDTQRSRHRASINPSAGRRGSRAERHASRRAYGGLKGDAAFAVARRTFSLQAPQSVLPLSEPGVRLVRQVGDFAAVVSTGSKRALTVSTLPLTARSKSGRKVAASLKLESRGNAYAPHAPLVPLRIAKRLGDGFLLASAIRVRPVNRRGSTLARIDDQTAFFANSDTDTDVLVQATPRGAETSWQLRSDRSSERHRLRLSLPTGTTLQMSTQMPGGAVIANGTRELFTIAPPTAQDADGIAVPVSMRVGGDVLTVTARHKGRGLRYPILVDPAFHGVVRENYGDFFSPGNGAEAGFPNFFAAGGAPFSFASSSVLQIGGSTGVTNRFGYYYIQAPGSSQIQRVDVDNAYFLNPANKPAYFYAYVGPSAPGFTSAWTTNATNGTSLGTLPLYFPATFGPVSFAFCPGHFNGQSDSAGTGFCYPGAGVAGNSFQIGVYTQANWANAGYLTQIGGASVQFVDYAAPTNVTLSGVPAEWVETASSVSVSGRQGGLGIGAFSVRGSNGAALAETDLGCYFDRSASPSRRGPTTTTLPPCPQGPESRSFDLSAIGFSEGASNLTGVAQSITGIDGTSPAQQLKIDRTPPAITASGSLYDRRGTTLAAGSYQLRVDARDGDRTTDGARRSGVTSVQVTIDEETVDSFEAACPQDSCSVVRDITVSTSDYPGGSHTARIGAEDALGHLSTTSFSFSTPCCLDAPGTAGSSTLLDRVHYGDVNGDAKDDAVIVDVLGGVNVALSNGAQFGAPQRWGTVPLPLLAATSVGDVNSDGRADIVYREPTLDLLNLDAQRVQVMLSTGAQFAAAANWGPWSSRFDLQLADVDGDEGDDLIGRESSTGRVQVAYSLDDKFAPGETWATVSTSLRWTAADPNGDGFADLVLRDPSTGRVTVATSDSGSFAAPTLWSTVAGNGDVLYADADSNLADDVWVRSSSDGAVRVGASDRRSFDELKSWGTVASGDVQVDLADIDGDGRDDVLTRNKLTGVITASRSNVVTPVYEEEAFVPDPTVEFDDEPAAAAGVRAAAAGNATMKLAWADDPLLVGEKDRNDAAKFTKVDAARANRAILRMKQAGATTVRLIVFWGVWANRKDAYRSALRDAVGRLNANGMTVYMTLTGAEYDDRIANQKTSVNPVPAQFGMFVDEIVREFLPRGVADYAMWNEPNLSRGKDTVNGGFKDALFLQTADCPGNSRKIVTTAKLYQSLYVEGYRAAKAAATAVGSSARAFLGEFSEQPNKGYPSCASARKDSLNVLRYLERVVDDPAGAPLKTAGVAWHPYQTLHPDDRQTNIVGIGRINDLKATVQRLAKVNKLRTEQDKAPRLYLTEFGYFNRPHRAGGPWFSEAVRASRLDRALKKARSGDFVPRMFVFYELVEVWPIGLNPTQSPPPNPQPQAVLLANPDNLGKFDTGLVHPATLAVTGVRPYGRGDFGQRRRAFCAIRTYARRAGGYPLLAPQPTSVLPDNCP